MRTIETHDFVRSLIFTHDGKTLVVGTDNKLILMDFSAGEEISEFHTSQIADARAISPDGSLLAFPIWSNDIPTVSVYDFRSEQIAETLLGNENLIEAIAFNAAGKLVASGDYSDRIVVWDISSGTEIFRVDGIPVRSLAFSPADPWLLASAGDDGVLRLWDVQNMNMLKETPVDDCNETCLTALAFGPDGRLLATGSLDGSIQLWGIPK